MEAEMRRVVVIGAVAMVLLAVPVIIAQQKAQRPAASGVTPADYLRWRTELRNWGRWGPDDELGTLNHITPEDVINMTLEVS